MACKILGLLHTAQSAISRRRRIFEVSVPGETARAFRDGALVCPGNAYWEIRWEDFLRSRLGRPGERLQAAAQ